MYFIKLLPIQRVLRPRVLQPTKIVTLRCPLWARVGEGAAAFAAVGHPARAPDQTYAG